MRFKMMIAVLGLVSVLSASQAFAFGGGGGHHDAQMASAAGSAGSAVSSLDSTGPAGPGPTAATSEPLALFAVGLGLLGARFLRRR